MYICTLIKPFLKWVGGKTQILNHIVSTIPTDIMNYHEPFLGGGSVLLKILSLMKEGKINIRGEIYASDVNVSLINLYKDVQNNKDVLYAYIKQYMDKYDGESSYYNMRTLYNTGEMESVEKSALFLILNKLCFRGLYREGPRGFNVPFGNYKNTNIVDKEHLDTISNLIQPVSFKCQDFRQSLSEIGTEDFVYLDPPYAPESSKSFVGYNLNGFSSNDHIELFNMTKKLERFTISNANVDIVRE